MKISGRRLPHILLVLAAMLAVFARTAYAQPEDETTPDPSASVSVIATTTLAPAEPTTRWEAPTDDEGNTLFPPETTTRWEPPTDEEGNTLFPPETTTAKPTTTVTTTTRTTTRPFVVNPAHPEDTYNGPLGLRPNPDLFISTEENTTAEPTEATTPALAVPEELGYAPGHANLRKILLVAAAALLPIALIVAFAMVAKGRREEKREAMRAAQRAAREKAAARHEIASTAAEPPTPLLNPLPPPADRGGADAPANPRLLDELVQPPDESKAGTEKRAEAPKKDYKDFLARFDEENPWFLQSLEPSKKEKPEDGE